MFLNQAQATAYSGFMEGQLGADPAYGTCFQCAAIDRARLKTNPVTPRSAICSSCFKKYCYDPKNPPPEGQIVGRRLKFKDPDPFGLKTFYQEHKAAIIVAAVFVVSGLIATITGCVMFWRRRFQRKKARSAVYQRLSRGEESEWSTYMGRQSRDMATSYYAEPNHETEKLRYSEPSFEPLTSHYASSSYEMGEPHYAEPSYGVETPHYAEPNYEVETSYYAEPRHEVDTPRYAEPSYEPKQPHGVDPGYGMAESHDAAPSHEMNTPHNAEPSYETAKPHSSEPSFEAAKPHSSEPRY